MAYSALHCLFSFDPSWCDGLLVRIHFFGRGNAAASVRLQPVHDTLHVVQSRIFLCDLRVQSTRLHVGKIVAFNWGAIGYDSIALWS